MTSCILTCNKDSESKELMETIWQAIRDWKEYERKEVLLFRWREDEKFNTALTIESSAPASVSVRFEATKAPRKYFELILDYAGEEQRLQIPADVVAKISNEKDIIELGNDDSTED